MGTRSITHIYEMDSDKVVCSFYRHWDGYPEGHGKDLENWLKDKTLTNGIGPGHDKNTTYNRAGTMAVKLMNHIQDISGCEVIATGSDGCWVDYTYHVFYKNGKFEIEISEEE